VVLVVVDDGEEFSGARVHAMEDNAVPCLLSDPRQQGGSHHTQGDRPRRVRIREGVDQHFDIYAE
jgi:hypothetical protein